MKAIKVPRLDSAQFAGEPRDRGYEGVQVPSRDTRFIGLARATGSKDCSDEFPGQTEASDVDWQSYPSTCRASSPLPTRPMTRPSAASPARPRAARSGVEMRAGGGSHGGGR